MSELTLAFVQAALQAPISEEAEHATRIITDSRKVEAGDVFVALVGEQFDGHDYVADVLTKGVAAVIVSREVVASDARQIVVADTLAALGQVAQAWRFKLNPKIVALTGSNGKTTVKEMCAAILREALGEDAVLATAGNFNNEIGMPLTLLRLQAAHQVAVLEMGMNHFGELSRLTQIARPDVALVNNALRAHIGNDFNGVADIARAKSEIYAGLSPDAGIAILPCEDQNLAIFAAAAAQFQQTTFGLHTGDVHADQIVLAPLCSDFVLTDGQDEVQVHLPVAGEHNVYNAAAAAAAVRAIGISWQHIAAGLAKFHNVKGRLQGFTSKNGALIVDDTYNANPDSMKAALDVLSRFDGTKVFVMGAIGELGATSLQLHAEVGTYANEKDLTALLALGADAKAASEASTVGEFFDDVDALIAAVRQYDVAGSTILVKGSRFMQMERVVEALLHTTGK
ncbi:UDP-N-acetylmuramoyl-tripeptide--D-alanyl-D-alanine ligase [Vitreoscilla massiliensis]|uniref:UDP-N-acetylmuramoyl-tripeptide--D-alanyl-D-alanine ligase n=1 Tax=Vitreoscilla massiliensis TaxID=1689272 RepID=A0ABY4DX64_9NEIS|nr:UDP-N-acetylmuramoyl-tripeptide--D-alanyl-D-alanine ligase [Vitreoscilla massiliensis]UOO88106.1 UDP-N-acetylmuramoyl-tripeptide--D-alanyl-D-alanine ligase [Vitreoscilla massiliensis]